MRIDEKRAFVPVRVGVMVVSDTRTLDTDTSGAFLEKSLREAGHEVVARVVVPDDKERIVRQLRVWIADPRTDAVISSGGTGLTGRDVTPEAFHEVCEKEIEGFAVVFHQVSLKTIGVSTVQSRATAGVAGGTYLFALPGSRGACRDAWEHILRFQLDSRFRPCNFVEIMPRLQER